MSAKKVAFLFDIDGTLLTVYHHGRWALTRAIGLCCGVDTKDLYLEMAGRTDLSIIKEALAIFKQAERPEIIHEISKTYLELLAEALKLPEALFTYPGVAELLAALQAGGALLGLGTGNMQQGAWLKVEKAGLASYFSFGGYGDDDEDRAKVLEIGKNRGAALLENGATFDLWVVGDTPLDIKAAKAIGAKVCAVASGRYKRAELLAFKPDLAFDDLVIAKNNLLNLL